MSNHTYSFFSLRPYETFSLALGTETDMTDEPLERQMVSPSPADSLNPVCRQPRSSVKFNPEQYITK